MATRFRDRCHAGRLLGEKLAPYANQPYGARYNTLVLALPRGGVPVAYEVARALNAPLDVFVVRKLGVPGQEELAMGAIATGGLRVLNRDVIRLAGLGRNEIEVATDREREELERREHLFRGNRPPPDVRGRAVIIVDDGLATGSTMRVAAEALRTMDPESLVVAVPTGSPDVCQAMRQIADDTVCVQTPDPFYAVGAWYDDFTEVGDQEVSHLLCRANGWRERRAA